MLFFLCTLFFIQIPKALSQTNSITIIGDSLTVGARSALQEAYPNATIDAEVGRQWATGISVLRNLNSQGSVGNTIIFPLGSNGPVTKGDIDTLVGLANGKAIVLITLFTTDQSLAWIQPNNTIIRNAAQEYSNIKIADWASIASNNPSLISSDGIHPTLEGYTRLAQTIITTTGQGSSNSKGSNNTGSPSLSYRSDSNEIRTRVGNPKIAAPGADSLVGVGLTIKQAYDTCSGGDSHQPPASLSCLQNQLRDSGFSETQINAFSQTYPTRLVGSPIGRSASCIQCLGFAGLVLSTYTNDGGTLRYASPSQMTGLQSFSAGGIVFQRLPSGTKPQPGDVGVHGGGTFGHIVFVIESVGNVRFKALESNGNADCRITDNRDILIDNYGYTFFRQQ